MNIDDPHKKLYKITFSAALWCDAFGRHINRPNEGEMFRTEVVSHEIYIASANLVSLSQFLYRANIQPDKIETISYGIFLC